MHNEPSMEKTMPIASRARPRSGGFTLFELMISLAILAILVGVGAPSMRSFINSSRLSAAASSYYDALRFSREQAAQVNHIVTLCPDNGAGACSASTGVNWQTSGLKLIDGNDSSIVYRRWPAIRSSITMTPSVAMASMSFNPDGSNDLTGTQSMKFCDPAAGPNSAGRVVVFNSAGFLSMSIANSTTAGVYRSCP
jgi:type IV fimbrial biogenesis protein FimT